jgi:hypothetical protein
MLHFQYDNLYINTLSAVRFKKKKNGNLPFYNKVPDFPCGVKATKLITDTYGM